MTLTTPTFLALAVLALALGSIGWTWARSAGSAASPHAPTPAPPERPPVAPPVPVEPPPAAESVTRVRKRAASTRAARWRRLLGKTAVWCLFVTLTGNTAAAQHPPADVDACYTEIPCVDYDAPRDPADTYTPRIPVPAEIVPKTALAVCEWYADAYNDVTRNRAAESAAHVSAHRDALLLPPCRAELADAQAATDRANAALRARWDPWVWYVLGALTPVTAYFAVRWVFGTYTTP